MKKKLKIAIYSGSIPSTTFIEQLIKGISEKHTVYLFGKEKEHVPCLNSNIKTFSYGDSTFRNIFQAFIRTLLLLFKYPKRFVVLINQIQKQHSRYRKRQSWIKIAPVLLNLPAVFHIQWAKDLENWMFLQELEVKIVLSLRGAHINYSPIAEINLANSYKKNFPKVDAFHAVSEAIKIEAQKYRAAPDKITVIHSLLPQSTFDLFKLPQKKHDDLLRIISVGRHHWKKGYTTALDACKILKERKIPFIYTIVAQGKVPEALFVQRHTLDLCKEVIFEKGIEQSKLFQIMQQNDVLLLPSLEEGIANVVLEAMAIGLPLISTDCGGMSEVVLSNITGWLVPVLDQEKMAEQLICFNETLPIKKREIIENAFVFVNERFNNKNEINSFVKFYQKII
jgi:glycosyltransferase involved in cell wall biosynthesis